MHAGFHIPTQSMLIGRDVVVADRQSSVCVVDFS